MVFDDGVDWFVVGFDIVGIYFDVVVGKCYVEFGVGEIGWLVYVVVGIDGEDFDFFGVGEEWYGVEYGVCCFFWIVLGD